MCDELSRNISGWLDATTRFIFVCGAAGCAPLDVISEKRPLATRWIILGNSEASDSFGLCVKWRVFAVTVGVFFIYFEMCVNVVRLFVKRWRENRVNAVNTFILCLC